MTKEGEVYKFDLKSEKDVKNLTSMIKKRPLIISAKNIEITIPEKIGIKDLIEVILSVQKTDNRTKTSVSIKTNNDQLTIKNQVIEFQTIETFNKYSDNLKEIKDLKGISIDKPIENRTDLEMIVNASKNTDKNFYIQCKPGFAKKNFNILKNNSNLYLNGVASLTDKHLDPLTFLEEVKKYWKEETNQDFDSENWGYSPDDLLKCLVVQGGDCEFKINLQDKELIQTPLILLAQFNNDLLEIAINNTSDLNKKDSSGNTPLLWAIANAEYKNADILIKYIKTEDLNIINEGDKFREKLTPMHLLVIKGRPNPTSTLGQTNKNITLNVLEALLKKGVPLQKDISDNDAFDYALEKQDFEMIKLFAQYVDPKIVKEKFQKHMKEINTLLNSNDEMEKNKKINLLLFNLGARCGNGFSHTYDQRNKYHEVFFLDVDQAFSEKNLTQIKEFMEEKLN